MSDEDGATARTWAARQLDWERRVEAALEKSKTARRHDGTERRPAPGGPVKGRRSPRGRRSR